MTGAEIHWLKVETALGVVLLGWTRAGLARLELPSSHQSGAPDEPPAVPFPSVAGATPPVWIETLAARVARHLEGAPQDFGDVPIDMAGWPPFFACARAAARTVPAGSVVTYGELAALAGRPGAARAAGRAMATNPVPLVVPCHRVVASVGIGGFSSGGPQVKERLLALEGASLPTKPGAVRP